MAIGREALRTAALEAGFVVFGVVLERGGPDYVPFLFTGLVPWRWFTSSLPHAGNSLVQGRGLMQQVYLPKVILPTVTILTDTVKFAFVFVVLLVFLRVYGCPLELSYLALPVVVLVQLLLVAAGSYLVAALVPFFQDLTFVVDYVLRLLFFVSGIFWSIDAVENEQYRYYLRLNPVASLLDAYRGILLAGEWPPAEPLLWIGLASLGGIAICGIAVYAFSGLVIDYIVVQHVGSAQFIRPMEAFMARVKISLTSVCAAGSTAGWPM